MNYVVLFSGGVDDKYNHSRYLNDLGFLHKTLIYQYNYDISQIKTLYAKGGQVTYEGHSFQSEEANKVNLEQAIVDISQRITVEDSFILIVSNHGAKGGRIFEWGNQIISKNEILYMLNFINVKKILVFGQCFGGDFVNEQLDNTVIISANEPNKPSYGGLEQDSNGKIIQIKYDEFLYHFTAYLNGAYPNNKSLVNTNGGNNIHDAFLYAKKQDFLKKGLHVGGKIHQEIPQIKLNNVSTRGLVL